MFSPPYVLYIFKEIQINLSLFPVLQVFRKNVNPVLKYVFINILFLIS